MQTGEGRASVARSTATRTVEITGLSGMEQAGPGQLTFLANPKYAHKVRHTKASAILAAQPVTDGAITSLVSANPYLDFRPRARALLPPAAARARNPSPRVYRRSARQVGENASIGPFVSVGPRARIGRNAVLHPHVVIYEGAEIGDDFLRPFARRGARVLPHRPPRDAAERRGGGRRRLRLRQARRRHALQDRAVRRHGDRRRRRDPDADLGGPRDRWARRASSAAPRSTAWCRSATPARWARTTSSARRRAWRAAAILERNVLLAGQVGVSGHLTIHDNAVVYAQSGIGGDVPAGSVMSGSPGLRSTGVAAGDHRVPDVCRNC